MRTVAELVRSEWRRAFFAGTALVSWASAASAQPTAPSEPFADLAARLLPAVVNISTSQLAKPEAKGKSAPASPFDEFFKDFLEHQGQSDGPAQPGAHGRKAVSLGSGFIVAPSGLIVTNNHVIADADEITVILQDDTNLKAQIVGRDEKTDLALLRVKADHPLPALSFGDSDKERVGDWVMAVGNPYGLGGTVTAGILSARGREISPDSGPYDDFLQTDAPINRGNSGGPLFNLDGEVIGINSAIFSPSGGSIGIGFAIPSSLAQLIVGQLREFGHARRGYLGARIETVTPEIARDLGLPAPGGVLVADVLDGSPAEKAGVAAGDVILSLGGKNVADARRFERLVDDGPVGDQVPATIWHDHASRALDVTLAEAPEPEQQAKLPKQPEDAKGTAGEVKELGLTLSTATPDLKQKYQLDDNAAVVVTGVSQNGPAADKDLKPGDVVVEVAQEEVKAPDDIARKIDEARKAGRKSVLLLIDRSGDLRFVALRLDRG